MTDGDDRSDQEDWRRDVRRFWWSAGFFVVSVLIFATLVVIGLYH